MKTAERPTIYRGPEGQRGLLTIIADRQKAAGDIFVSATVLPAKLATIGLEAATDVVVELGSRRRIVRKFYDKEKFKGIVDSSESLRTGEHERYTRYVGEKPYTVDFYPKGLSIDTATELATSQTSELTHEDFYGRFNQLPGDKEQHTKLIRSVYHQPDAMVMIVRDDDNVVGSSILASDGASNPTYEFAFDVTSGHQQRGLGSMLMLDMLTVCEVKGIHQVVMEIDQNNYKSKRRVNHLRIDKDIPWSPNVELDGGILTSRVVYSPQKLEGAA